MKVNRSEIDIDAPVEKVWNIIIDLERYPEWNTFTPRMGAKQIVVGEEFLLDCQMTEKQLLRDEKKYSWPTSQSGTGSLGEHLGQREDPG